MQKQHYGGVLSRGRATFIAAEAVGQAALIGWLYTASAELAWAFSAAVGAWFAACSLALALVPLHAQRPLSVLCFLATVGLDGLAPPTPGLEWARVVLPAKYLLCHPVRHEPYRVRGASR